MFVRWYKIGKFKGVFVMDLGHLAWKLFTGLMMLSMIPCGVVAVVIVMNETVGSAKAKRR